MESINIIHVAGIDLIQNLQNKVFKPCKGQDHQFSITFLSADYFLFVNYILVKFTFQF